MECSYPQLLANTGAPQSLSWNGKTHFSTKSHFHIHQGRQWVEIHDRHICIPAPLIRPAGSTLGEMKVNVAVFVPNYNQ